MLCLPQHPKSLIAMSAPFVWNLLDKPTLSYYDADIRLVPIVSSSISNALAELHVPLVVKTSLLDFLDGLHPHLYTRLSFVTISKKIEITFLTLHISTLHTTTQTCLLLLEPPIVTRSLKIYLLNFKLLKYCYHYHKLELLTNLKQIETK